jgi:hypothetical protein
MHFIPESTPCPITVPPMTCMSEIAADSKTRNSINARRVPTEVLEHAEQVVSDRIVAIGIFFAIAAISEVEFVAAVRIGLGALVVSIEASFGGRWEVDVDTLGEFVHGNVAHRASAKE